MTYTKEFSQLSKDDAHLAGGKGASLGEMIQSSIPVPDGYVVLAGTFDTFLDESNLTDEIQTILSHVDLNIVHTIEDASEKIQYLILNAEISEPIITEIRYQFKKLDSEFVAVRSSATAEDGAEHAWAGQLSSFLNVTEEMLVEKVQECWASLFTTRAIFYRFEKGLNVEEISVAVVVQKMVNSEKSGVGFSVHPVTEDREQIIIEAGYGLGEAIVSGEVTPDSYVIHKTNKKIISCDVSNQSKALFRSDCKTEDGYNTWQTLENDVASSQVLSEKETLELAEIIKNIEAHYGFPCDVEWAYEDGRFYITQSRPITTLGLNAHNFETILWQKIWEAGNAPVFEMTHGTLLAYPIQKEIGLVDEEMAVVGTKEKVSAYYTEKSLSTAAEDGKKYFLEQADTFLETSEDLINSAHDYVLKNETTAVTTESFKVTSELLRNLFAYFNCTNPQFTSSLESEVLSEISDLVDTDPESVFRDLCVSQKHSLIQLEQIDWMKLVIAVQKGKDAPVLLKEHFEKYKYLVGDEGNKKVSIESLQELLESEIQQEIRYELDLDKALAFTNKLKELKAKHISEYNLSDTLVKKTRILSDVGHVRLELRSAWTAVFHLIRMQLESLREQNNLDIDLLLSYTADEIVEWIEAKKQFIARPTNFSVNIQEGECSLLFGEEAKTKDDFCVQENISDDGALKGNTAFPGNVTGEVVVIEWGSADFDEKLSNFPEGAVLVAGQTRPMLVPAIKKALAIVTDEGGITSHAAIVAREFQKPCVIGTGSATEVLKDGDLVQVDATNGFIKIISGKSLDPKDYIRMFAGKSFDYLVSDIFLKYYNRFGVISLQDNVSWMSVFPKNKLEETLEEGKEIYTSEENFKKYKEDFDSYIKSSQSTFESILNKEQAITAKDVKSFFGLATEHFNYYSKTEFFYTDLLKQPEMVISVAEFDKLKLDGRAHLNKLFFEDDGFIKTFVSKIANETNTVKEDLFMYTVEELKNLVDSGSVINSEILEARKHQFFFGAGYELSGLESEEYVSDFFSLYREVSDTIQGTVANKGRVRGQARVLIPDAANFNQITKEVEKMLKGEILIAETTSPEIIQACKKAAAIVTNQGGMLSHAAIISRELGIPCIIGTDKDVVLSIKTGDVVEVDAELGVVKVIQR